MSAQNTSKKPVIVTSGDPCGIGPEITLKAALNSQHHFVAVADPKHMEKLSAELGLDLNIRMWHPDQDFEQNTLSILEIKWPAEVIAGNPNDANSNTILKAIEIAVEQVKIGNACALVTNPINKFVLYQAGFDFPGHTEFLAFLSKQEKQPVMMLANKYLRVIPVTIHNAVAEIPKKLTSNLIYRTIVVARRDLIKFFGISDPKIVVCGLNPHAGENGSLGNEDLKVIKPTILKLQEEGVSIKGPLSADSLFHSEARNKYDCVVGMYHDQVLPVVKALDFAKTVNITLGLDFIRTSPDHGTAYDIAGKNIANAESLIAAINTAETMSNTSLKFADATNKL